MSMWSTCVRTNDNLGDIWINFYIDDVCVLVIVFHPPRKSQWLIKAKNRIFVRFIEE